MVLQGLQVSKYLTGVLGIMETVGVIK